MVDVAIVLSIVSAIVSVLSFLSIHLRSNCCDNNFSFDILSQDEYKLEHEHEECKR